MPVSLFLPRILPDMVDGEGDDERLELIEVEGEVEIEAEMEMLGDEEIEADMLLEILLTPSV